MFSAYEMIGSSTTALVDTVIMLFTVKMNLLV